MRIHALKSLAVPVIAVAIAVTACGGTLSQFICVAETPEKVALTQYKLVLHSPVSESQKNKPEVPQQKKEPRPTILKPVSDFWDLASGVHFDIPPQPLSILPPQLAVQLPLDRLSIGFSLANHDPTLPPGRAPPLS